MNDMNVKADCPMISVIIPAYNAENTIEACVKSVCGMNAHDHEVLEIIIVDDGSTDNTAKVCDSIAEDNPLVKVIHVSNGGVSKARNLGIEKASGKYIAFVDADDSVTDTYLNELLTAAKSRDVKVVIMDGKVISDGLISGRRYIEDGILGEDTHVWSKLFSREVLDGIRFPEGLTIGEDMLFLLDLFMKVEDELCIACISGHGYNYSINEEGAMLQSFKPAYLDQLTCWEMAEAKLGRLKTPASERAVLKLSVIKIMAALLVVGKYAASGGAYEAGATTSAPGVDAAMNAALKDTVISRSREMITKALQVKGVFGALSLGYKVKTCLFRFSSSLYMSLYGRWKQK